MADAFEVLNVLNITFPIVRFIKDQRASKFYQVISFGILCNLLSLGLPSPSQKNKLLGRKWKRSILENLTKEEFAFFLCRNFLQRNLAYYSTPKNKLVLSIMHLVKYFTNFLFFNCPLNSFYLRMWQTIRASRLWKHPGKHSVTILMWSE